MPVVARPSSQSHLNYHYTLKLCNPLHNSEGLEPPGLSVPAAMGLITSDRCRHICHHHRVLPDSRPQTITHTTLRGDSNHHSARSLPPWAHNASEQGRHLQLATEFYRIPGLTPVPTIYHNSITFVSQANHSHNTHNQIEIITTL